MGRPVRLVVFLLIVAKIEGCARETFVDAEIKISRKNELMTASTIFKVSGCINPSTIYSNLGRAVVAVIECKGQNVPVLHENAVENLPELDTAYFSHNGIKRVKKGAFFNLPRLLHLDLSYNLIETIEKDTLAGLSISILSLGYNKLVAIEGGGFANLPNLQRLGLEHNLLEGFESEWFTNSDKLYYLEINDNYIRSVQKNTFQPFKLLSTIELSSNHLHYIDKDAFKGLEALEDLFLYNNRLRKLQPGVFQSLMKLNSLWIYGNNLTYISNETLAELNSKQLFQLTIHTNPWQCACYDKILEWARGRNVFVVTGIECYNDNNPFCVVPEDQPDLCLEDREEDVNALYYEHYNFNHSCTD